MPDRFVILHHTLHDGEHWDLMLESGDSLLTWQLPREPLSVAVLPLPARRIGDHRKRYLDYEGPLSGDRGAVRRVDAGNVTIESRTDDELLVTLQSPRLAGRFRLRKAPDTWWFESA